MEGFHLSRRIWHMSTGTIIAILMWYEIITLYVAGIAILIGLTLSMIDKYWFKLPVIHSIAEILDRPEDLKKFPGKGAIMFMIGVFLALLIFEKEIAVAGILILAIGDSVAPLAGKYGKIKSPLDERKTIEGVIAGIIVAGLVVSFLIPPWQAFLAATFGMIAEQFKQVNDNISMPLVSGFVIWALRML